MKKLAYLLFLLPLVLTAQLTTNENYILNRSYKVPSSIVIPSPSVNQAAQTVIYLDGIGREKQNIAVGQSAITGRDIVKHIEYDALGQQVKNYLPHVRTGSSLSYQAGALSAQTMFYSTPNFSDTGNNNFEATGNAYTHTEIESPIGRIKKEAAPGNDWEITNGHTIKHQYETNIANDVKWYKVTLTSSYEPSLGNSSGTVYYGVNQLYKKIVFDENSTAAPLETSGSGVEFSDKYGQTILKRVYEGGVKLDTYYVYDDYGNLTYVIPPKVNVSGTITQAVLDDLCYQYKYDSRNRVVEKKLPGKQWEFMVYDKLNRIVAFGPSYFPFGGPENIGWMIVKYDVFDRQVYTGWYNERQVNTTERLNMQGIQNGTNALMFEVRATVTQINNIDIAYTNVVYPTTGFALLTINYYDDYGFPNAPSVPSSVMSDNSQPVYYNNTTKPKGLLTATWVRVLTGEGEFKGNQTHFLYDNKERVVRTFVSNYLTGYTQTDNKIDFSGKILLTETKHKRAAADTELKTTQSFTYSAQDRLLTHHHQINSLTPQLIAENSYDELGQLISKKVGNSSGSPLQKIDYNYNIRGWLKGINNDSAGNLNLNASENDLFGLKLNYNTVENYTNYTGTPLYNGNISESYWRVAADNILRKYGYYYDKLNRLINAVYMKPEFTDKVTNAYNESVTYDNNGNIMTLNRNGDFDHPDLNMAIPIDNLTYSYKSGNTTNRLASVTDSAGANSTLGFKDGINAGDDYEYDDFGNLIRDLNKGINPSGTNPVRYNHVNQPTEIVFSTSPIKKISYIYDANGKKMQRSITTNTTTTVTDYLNGFQYKNNNLMFFPTAEGYVNYDSGVYKYVFNHTDHLGNNRISYVGDPNSPTGLSVLEYTHYYPFGLKHTNYNVTIMKLRGNTPEASLGNGYKYKYNGKELQDELGLNVYDYGWRNYDPAIGRFNKMDRYAEKYYNNSPYNYAGNNPVLNNDIAGDSIGAGKDLFEKFRKHVLERRNKILADRKAALDKLAAKGKGDKAKKLEERYAKNDAEKGTEMHTLNTTIAELDELESSKQLYNLFENASSVPKDADGITTYDIATNAVNVSSKGAFSNGVFAHELKHASQFQQGLLSFSADGKTGGILYDLTDEYDAFTRGDFFGGLSLTRNQIDEAYPHRQSKATDMRTPRGNKSIGAYLRQTTKNAAVAGTAQQNFYINWQNDKK